MRISKEQVSGILAYGTCLAAGAFLLQWLDYQHVIRRLTPEVYIIAIATLFTALGLWLGRALTPVTTRQNFVRNENAIGSLGITKRELDVLLQLARGRANHEIADALNVSPNTVKTHIGRIYGKLDVARRTQAILKARSIGIIE